MSCAWCAFWITAYSWLHVDKWQTGNKYQFPFYSEPGTLLFVYLVCWGKNSKNSQKVNLFLLLLVVWLPPWMVVILACLWHLWSVDCPYGLFGEGSREAKGMSILVWFWGGVVFFCFFICWEIFSEHFFFIHSIKENSHLALDIY